MGGVDLFASRSDTWTYVMATPDAVVGGALPFVLERVRAWHLRPSACRLVGLDVGKMQRFYGGTTFVINNPGFDDYHFPWSTHETLYNVAPACLVMLSHESGAACETMLRCKGHVRPELADRGAIRRMGENVIFNLVHSPDDTASALRELTILIGAEGTERLLGACDAVRDDAVAAAALTGVEVLRDALPVFHGPAATSFPAIAERIRHRIIMHLAVVSHFDEDILADLSRARAALVRQREALAKCSTTEERMLCAQATERMVPEVLARAARRYGDPALVAGVEALSELYVLRGRRRPEAIIALSGQGVYISPLERVIVESHSHAFRLNKEIEGIYA